MLAVTAARAITDRIARSSGHAAAPVAATVPQQQEQPAGSPRAPPDQRSQQLVQPAVPATQALKASLPFFWLLLTKHAGAHLCYVTSCMSNFVEICQLGGFGHDAVACHVADVASDAGGQTSQVRYKFNAYDTYEGACSPICSMYASQVDRL